MRAGLIGRLVVLSVLVTMPAWSQADAPTRAAARQLAQQGLTFYQEGKYAEALDSLERAASLVSVPTLHLHVARTLEKLGRWVEANERYLLAQRTEPQGGDLAEQRRAQELAASEQKALAARIPKLTITLDGDSEGVLVKLDDRELPAALLGASQPIDPGEHRVVAERGAWRDEKRVTLAEGARETMRLGPAPARATPAPAGPAPLPRTRAEERPETTPERAPAPSTDQGSSQRTIGWIGIGVGGAGLVFGAIAGSLALGRKGTLDDECRERQCGPAQYDDVDAYDRLKLLSTIGFSVGVVATAGGITLLLTAPSEKSAITAHAGPRGISLRGRF